LNAALGEKEAEIGVHLAIFVEPFLSAVLDGRKTMESRFALTRQPPYNCVEDGDIILLKRSGGPVVGLAEAGETQSYILSPRVVHGLRQRYADRLFACDDAFWSEREHKNYATLIEIKDTVEVDAVSIPKRDRRGWVSYTCRNERRQTELA
jgi:hypothetical protein